VVVIIPIGGSSTTCRSDVLAVPELPLLVEVARHAGIAVIVVG
jgi:hypothetical protein